jgi:hypothetical protein
MSAVMTVKKSPAITTHIAPRAFPGRALKGALTGFMMVPKEEIRSLKNME